jgi:NTE family protein
VIEVLLENGIEIDMVAGTSMGSVIGGIYASGTDIYMMRKFCENITTLEGSRLYDLAIPRLGMVRGKKIEELIFTFTGNRNIEDLEIPYVAAACCVEDAKPVYFTEGSVVDAIRASISIPGVFEPVVRDGKTLVDGGVLERSPVNILRDMGADYIICSDVNYRGGENPKPKNMFSMLFTVYEMMEWQAMSQRVVDADISIISDTKGINPASFAHAKKCMDIGRASAEDKIDEIKTALTILNKKGKRRRAGKH